MTGNDCTARQRVGGFSQSPHARLQIGAYDIVVRPAEEFAGLQLSPGIRGHRPDAGLLIDDSSQARQYLLLMSDLRVAVGEESNDGQDEHAEDKATKTRLPAMNSKREKPARPRTISFIGPLP